MSCWVRVHFSPAYSLFTTAPEPEHLVIFLHMCLQCVWDEAGLVMRGCYLMRRNSDTPILISLLEALLFCSLCCFWWIPGKKKRKKNAKLLTQRGCLHVWEQQSCFPQCSSPGTFQVLAGGKTSVEQQTFCTVFVCFAHHHSSCEVCKMLTKEHSLYISMWSISQWRKIPTEMWING